MREVPECEENTFDGLHCPRWYGGGRCSYCGLPQPTARDAGLVCQACAGDAPRGKCLNPKCVGGPIVREILSLNPRTTSPDAR